MGFGIIYMLNIYIQFVAAVGDIEGASMSQSQSVPSFELLYYKIYAEYCFVCYSSTLGFVTYSLVIFFIELPHSFLIYKMSTEYNQQ